MPAERKRSNNSAGMDSRIFPMDGSESRTPMAWQQRNLNYQQQQQQQQTHNHQQQQQQLQQQQQQLQQQQQVYHTNTISYIERPHKVSNGHQNPPPRVSEEVQTTGRGRRSSSSTNTSSSTSTERASKNSRPVHSAPPPLPAYQGFGGTWDGEPCPIHHIAIMAPQAVMAPPQIQMMMPPMATLPRRPPAYDKNVVMMLPPMMRPRPLVVPAAEGPLEPLPMRDPKIAVLPRKEGSAGSEKSMVKQSGSCQGHTVVLWFIITVITIGVLLGAVLRFVMG